MKRTLQIHIDANRVTCGKCVNRHAAFIGRKTMCLIFGDEIRTGGPYDGDSEDQYRYVRCAPCLAAEREASK